jgi:integrase
MQRGCMQRNSRKPAPDIWQFRWSETRLDGKRLYHKKIIGTVRDLQMTPVKGFLGGVLLAH